MRAIVAGFGLGAAVLMAGPADAQRKGSTVVVTVPGGPSSSYRPSRGGYGQCEGRSFIISDPGSGPLCRRRDGRLCEVRASTSNRGVLVNCL
jgi:hypothetical protein